MTKHLISTEKGLWRLTLGTTSMTRPTVLEAIAAQPQQHSSMPSMANRHMQPKLQTCSTSNPSSQLHQQLLIPRHSTTGHLYATGQQIGSFPRACSKIMAWASGSQGTCSTQNRTRGQQGAIPWKQIATADTQRGKGQLSSQTYTASTSPSHHICSCNPAISSAADHQQTNQHSETTMIPVEMTSLQPMAVTGTKVPILPHPPVMQATTSNNSSSFRP